MKIILVDDNINFGNLLAEILDEVGHKATFFSNPITALEEIKLYHYDIGIFDIRMPQMDGLTLCKNVKMTRNGKEMKIVLLTGNEGDIYRNSAVRAGATDFLNKTEPPDRLVQTLEKIITA